MDNVGFIAAAYGLTFLFVGGYAWWLRRRIKDAETEAEMGKMGEIAPGE